MKTINTLPPFKRFCVTIGNLPSSYVDSMSYYECIMWLCKYLSDTVIPAVNENAEAVNELINWFNNLDVTEEINNKLDEMVEDGTLSELLGQYRIYVHVKELGAVDDGITDNSEILQSILDTYKNIYIDDGVYYATQTLYIDSDTNIIGTGTIKANLYIMGDNGENIPFTEISKNKITTEYVFNVNDLLKVFYENTSDLTNNRRQMVVTTSTDGKLSNNLLNYGSSYSVRKVNSKKNIKISDITIEGNIRLKYAQDIYFNSLTIKNGYITISECYNYNLTNSYIELGNDCRVDGMRGSSNLTFDNIKFSGGNTSSDNAALKLNEVFYSNVNNINFGTPNRDVVGYTGYFHAFMIDGDFAEDNYTRNESQYINISNCFVADGFYNDYFITLGKHINLTNITGENLQLKHVESIHIDNSFLYSIGQETNEIEDILVSNSSVDNFTTGTRKNTKFVNCKLGTITFAQGTNNIKLIGCEINKIQNSYVSNNSAKNVIIDDCEVFEKCQLSGFDHLIGKIISHVNVDCTQLNNSNVEILIIENNTNNWNNLNVQSCDNSKIFYHILEEALATTPLNSLIINDSCILESTKMFKANNNNANITQTIKKAGSAPNSGTHYRGEIVYNYAPSAGGVVGWVCVTGGTPGTWKSFGSIES